MTRRDFLACISFMMRPAGGGSQDLAGLRRVGVLASTTTPGTLFLTVFREALAELGWIEGKNVSIDWPKAGPEAEPAPERAAALVRAKPDVIVAANPASVLAAKGATTSIPIVMVNTADPVQLGVVDSLTRPGGNVTGTSTFSADISLKQLDLLRELLPQAKRVAVLWVEGNPWHPLALAALDKGARTLGLDLRLVKVSVSGDLEPAMAAMAAEQTDGALVLADPVTFSHRRWIAELALQYRTPAVYGLREHADVGGLMSYWAEAATLYRRTAAYVDKILRGAKVSDLPIEQATHFELIINLKTAGALGLAIPPSLLIRANEVIE
jgi:putative tryptophan/tyrosine transport system substrate-binding protein